LISGVVGGCDSSLAMIHLVQYFGRLRVIVTFFLCVDDKLLVLCAVAIDPLRGSIYLPVQ